MDKVTFLVFYLLTITSICYSCKKDDSNNPLQPETGKDIVYVLGSPASNQICTINIDGTGNSLLIKSPAALNEPEYSPDKKFLVVNGFFNPYNEMLSIFTYCFETGVLKQLTNTPGVWDNHPSFSPDGTLVVFSRRYAPFQDEDEIWMMHADGSNQHYLGMHGYHVKFSPEGSKLIFASNVSGNNEIYISNIDGSDVQNLTNNTCDDNNPSWSPDGIKIAFDSNSDDVNGEIYIMNSDGTNRLRLTTNNVTDAGPEWSPDGTRLVFVRASQGAPNGHVYIIDADGSNLQQVTSHSSPSWAQEPVWKPAD